MNPPGGHHSADTADLISRIGGLKQDVDILLQQLSEGEYLSVDTFANNWIHPTQLLCPLPAPTTHRALLATLVHSHPLPPDHLLAV